MFVASAIPDHPLFERRALPTYMLIAAMAVSATLLIWRAGMTVSPASLSIFISPVVLIVGAVALRRLGHSSVAGLIEALTVLYTQGLMALYLIVPVTAFNLPLSDPWLARADALLGFHWPTVATAAEPFAGAMVPAYNSFTLQPLAIIPALFICGDVDRAWRFVFAFALALVICCAVYAAVPAEGAAVYFGVRPSDLPGLGSGPWHFPTIIERIRGGVAVIDSSLAGGLISFPSFHTAGAIIFMWAAWPLPILRWPMIALNALVVVAAVPLGAHYLVDIIGGVLVAWISLYVSGLNLRDNHEPVTTASASTGDAAREASSATASAAPIGAGAAISAK